MKSPKVWAKSFYNARDRNDLMFNALQNIIKRCYLSILADDTKNYQVGQISYLGKPGGDAEILSLYGFSFNPPIKSQGIVLTISGREENRVALLNLPKQRFKNLLPGEVQVGNFEQQTSVKFDNDGNVTITSTKDVIVNSDQDVLVNSARDVTVSALNDVSVTAAQNVTVSGTTTVNVNSANINLTASSKVNIVSPLTSLGGGLALARTGDAIKVNVGGTDYFGTITGGGTNTSI